MANLNEYIKNIIISFKTDEVAQKKMNDILEGFEEKAKDLWKDSTKQLKDDLLAVFGVAGNSFGEILISAIQNAFEEASSMLKYSQLTDAGVRETAFKYGFDSAQNYGFNKALEIMGLSEESLYWMNTQQQEEFTKLFTKYSEKYDKLYDSGFFEKYQEFQYEMTEFKEEVTMELLEFFMKNKDTIMASMEALIWLSDFVISGLGNIIDLLSGPAPERSWEDREAAISDIINSSSQDYSSHINTSNSLVFNGMNINDTNLLNQVGSMVNQLVAQFGG